MKTQFPLFVGSDIGTQGTKSVVCDEAGNVLGEGFAPSALVFENGGVWESAESILGGVIASVKEAVGKSGRDARDVVAVGIDSQMSGIMAVDGDFGAVAPLDSWLDERCAPYTERLKTELGDEAVMQSGGQFIHSHASRILRMKYETPGLYEKTRKFVQPNAFAVGKICGLHAENAFVDYTFLHFNLLSDNENKRINETAANAVGISPDKLPRVVSPFDLAGRTGKDFERETGIPAGTAVVAGCGDTAASAFGTGITRKGLAYDVAGTASVFACCTDKFMPDVKNKTVMYARSVIDGLFTPLAYVTGGGLCLKRFRDLTGLSYRQLDREAAEAKAAEEGLFFARGFRAFSPGEKIEDRFVGITERTTRGAMYRAIMEAIAFEYKNYEDILLSSGAIGSVTEICGVGGGAASRVFSQIKADVLQAEYRAAKIVDSAPRASAMIAAKGTGYLSDPTGEIFSPDRAEGESFFPQRGKYEGKEKEYRILKEDLR